MREPLEEEDVYGDVCSTCGGEGTVDGERCPECGDALDAGDRDYDPY